MSTATSLGTPTDPALHGRSPAMQRSVRAVAGYRVGGRYHLLSELGTGGMGTVWRARDEVLHREVAVKEVTLPTGMPQAERELLCERTLREARAAARLNDPAVIRIYDVVSDDARPWIVMELLDARSLAELVRTEGPLPVPAVAAVGLALLDALECAHQAGVLHRDVKPGNVLVGAGGRTTLTDFGVARSHGDSQLTSTGLLLGSPQYIAPERARGQQFGPASDLWSLGATLHAAVEGVAPFDRGDPLPTMAAIVSDAPPPMTRSGALEPVLIALLDKDPLTRADHASTRAGLLAALGSDPLNFSALSFGSLNAGSLTSGSLKSGSLNSGSLNSGSLNSGRTAVGTMQSTRLRTAVVVSTAAAALLALCLVVYGLGLNLLDGTEPATARPPAAIAPIRSSNLTPIRATVGPGTFSIAVPTGWSRSGGNYVRFTDPTGKVWIQLYAERGEGQLDVWAAADRRATRGGGNLHHYRGAQSFPTAPLGPLAGNDWQYSYLRDGESERRLVIDRGAVADGVSYQVALSAPVSQFARYRPILDKVTKSFRIG